MGVGLNLPSGVLEEVDLVMAQKPTEFSSPIRLIAVVSLLEVRSMEEMLLMDLKVFAGEHLAVFVGVEQFQPSQAPADLLALMELAQVSVALAQVY